MAGFVCDKVNDGKREMTENEICLVASVHIAPRRRQLRNVSAAKV